MMTGISVFELNSLTVLYTLRTRTHIHFQGEHEDKITTMHFNNFLLTGAERLSFLQMKDIDKHTFSQTFNLRLCF